LTAMKTMMTMHYSSIMKNHDLVGTWILCSIQLGISSSQLTFTPSFFRGVVLSPTTYYYPSLTI
jgi:hypothetical protein